MLALPHIHGWAVTFCGLPSCTSGAYRSVRCMMIIFRISDMQPLHQRSLWGSYCDASMPDRSMAHSMLSHASFSYLLAATQVPTTRRVTQHVSTEGRTSTRTEPKIFFLWCLDSLRLRFREAQRDRTFWLGHWLELSGNMSTATSLKIPVHSIQGELSCSLDAINGLVLMVSALDRHLPCTPPERCVHGVSQLHVST